MFAYGFKIFDQDDPTVILRAADGTETTQTITTHYTVSGEAPYQAGNVTFGTAPASGVTVVILREQPLTQGLDLVANDPFPSASFEDQLDKLTFMVQQHDEELGRTIKASKTNTITGSEFTISAADRANKIFAFDSSGDVNITQEIGTFKGNWAASTAYVVRDLVKDTSTNNIFIVNSAHTSSGSQPLTTNTNSAKYDLIVDAASASAHQQQLQPHPQLHRRHQQRRQQVRPRQRLLRKPLQKLLRPPQKQPLTIWMIGILAQNRATHQLITTVTH